jgi:hypothetical protein
MPAAIWIGYDADAVLTCSRAGGDDDDAVLGCTVQFTTRIARIQHSLIYSP